MTKPKNPDNINLMYQDKFKFVLQDVKHVEFFCYRVNVPGMSMSYQSIPTPTNQMFVGGKKLHYEDLTLSFRVNEDLTNYKEIFNWLVGIVGPQDTEQFKTFNDGKLLAAPKYNIFRDATLFSLTNSSNPNIQINFKDLFPFSLSGLDMDNASTDTVTATVGFRYDYYTFG